MKKFIFKKIIRYNNRRVLNDIFFSFIPLVIVKQVDKGKQGWLEIVTYEFRQLSS